MNDSTSREQALRAVKAPAIALVIYAAVAETLTLVSLLWQMIAQESFENAMAQQPEWARKMSFALSIIVLVLIPIVLIGGLKMMKLQSHGLALAAAIVAMLPLTCCCVFGLPIGVWALIVLLRADVKAGFAPQV